MTANLQKCCDSCGHVSYKLSKQETATYKLLVAGYTQTEIGRMLFRSKKTISTYKYRLLDKLGIDSDGGKRDTTVLLIHHAMREGLSNLTQAGCSGDSFLQGYHLAITDVTQENK